MTDRQALDRWLAESEDLLDRQADERTGWSEAPAAASGGGEPAASQIAGSLAEAV